MLIEELVMSLMDLSTLEQRVIDYITEERWQEMTVEMVRTGQPNSTNPSEPDMPAGQEEAIALFVAGKMEALG